MRPHAHRRGWRRGWAIDTEAAAWISDLDGRLLFLNQSAERLFRVRADSAIGQPCHHVIAAHKITGRPHCRPRCPVLALAKRGRPIPPIRLQISDEAGDQLWIWVLVISLTFAGESHRLLIHLAFPDRAGQRIDSYLVRVASRNQSTETGARVAVQRLLTPRELEVLEWLACDCSIDYVAAKLWISSSTVRNHLRNIHAKLRIHSTAEAVALYLIQPLGVTDSDRDEPALGSQAKYKLEPSSDVESAPGCAGEGAVCGTERHVPRAAALGKGAFAHPLHVARAIAQPRRLMMLMALRKREMCVYELAVLAGVKPAAACHHLAVLKRLGLVMARREGARTCYRAACPALRELWACIERLAHGVPCSGDTVP